MSAAALTAIAVIFVWLGMVIAISFIEAPVKFRAPGVDVRIGLGIGRLVFRALNTAEAALAVVLLVTVVVGGWPTDALVAAVVAVVLLVAQLAGIRPALTRRSDRILAGHDEPRSKAHYAYIAAESAKVIALLVAGILLLGAVG
ncbi:hypothetical protein NWF34_02470 [Gordonia sp. GONU]|uniref:hypothetical protein n=1 Tax=Gordonia TaxID=2053 RepID=UPI0004663632|nr:MULTISPECIES: hypothetical protein [Gordonia]MCR8895813.1 hypothetical protein [Gordonia sp. GONU]